MKKIHKYISAVYLLTSLITVLILYILSKNGAIKPIMVSRLGLILLGVYLLFSLTLFIIFMIKKTMITRDKEK